MGTKLPIIPPLLINNTLESEFKIKENYFNSFFALKYPSLLTIVLYLIPLNMFQAPGFSYCFAMRRTYQKLLMLLTSPKHMDMMIFQIINLSSKSNVKPLSLIFKNCINTGTFPDIWKRSNILHVRKKDDLNYNYRPVSPSFIFKNFARTIF